MNHSAAFRVKGLPVTTLLAAIAISAVIENKTTTGRYVVCFGSITFLPRKRLVS